MDQSNEQSNQQSNQVNIEVKDSNILYFCDGVDEAIEAETATEVTTPHVEDSVNPTTLSWGPWFSYYAYQSGTKVLNAVDYAGESLANFFGITTPKYQIEIDEYHRVVEERKKMEEESAGWVPNNGGGDIPLVINEPMKTIDSTNP